MVKIGKGFSELRDNVVIDATKIIGHALRGAFGLGRSSQYDYFSSTLFVGPFGRQRITPATVKIDVFPDPMLPLSHKGKR